MLDGEIIYILLNNEIIYIYIYIYICLCKSVFLYSVPVPLLREICCNLFIFIKLCISYLIFISNLTAVCNYAHMQVNSPLDVY